MSQIIPPGLERLLDYFDRLVFSHYRASPDKYSLVEDDMGGELKSSGGSVKVRFSHRCLSNGLVCVAAFVPDLAEIPHQDKKIWYAFSLENPQFFSNDPPFERWVARYLRGEWGIEEGPRCKCERLISQIRVLTRRTIGKPLFRFEENPLINYPIAENTDAFSKAHLELYRLVIDGLNIDAISSIAEHLKVKLSDSSKTMNSLKEVLPLELVPKIYNPLKECYEHRQRVHGVPQQSPTPFPAFNEFHKDLNAIAGALEEIKKWLEGLFKSDSGEF